MEPCTSHARPHEAKQRTKGRVEQLERFLVAEAVLLLAWNPGQKQVTRYEQEWGWGPRLDCKQGLKMMARMQASSLSGIRLLPVSKDRWSELIRARSSRDEEGKQWQGNRRWIVWG